MRYPSNGDGIIVPLHLSAEEREVWWDLLDHLFGVIWDETNSTDLRQAELYQKGRGGDFTRKARGKLHTHK